MLHSVNQPVVSRPVMACREIAQCDLPEVAALLCEGFPNHSINDWCQGLSRLGRHRPPSGTPRFGYILTADRAAVGCLLLIHAAARDQSGLRANVSSWYVRPEFRSYAAILNQVALRNRAVTYVNISAARHTWPLIEALGFRREWSGLFVGTTLSSAGWGGGVIHDALIDPPSPPHVAGLLADHAAFGCIVLWAETPDGCAPFVFRRRLLRRLRLPSAMLIHCPSIDLLERFAAPLSRALLKRGLPFLLAATPRKVRGFAGTVFPDRMPVYIKGDAPFAVGDLSYTEASIFDP